MTPVQLELVNAPRARRTDRSTAVAAAAAVNPGPTEHAILTCLRMVGPLTDEEIAARLPGLYEPTVRTARSRLSKRGLVVPTGETRRSARGREMHVWQVVQ